MNAATPSIHALRIAVDGTIRHLALPATAADQLTALHTAIGCHTIDVVRLTVHLDMWLVDESTLVDPPAVNKAATILVHHFGYYSRLCFGTAVLTGGTDRHGDLLPLSTNVTDHIRTLLAPYIHQPHQDA